MTHADRNKEICQRFVRGKETLEELGKAYGISRERIRQILDDEGLNKQDRVAPADKPVRETEFLGVNVPESVKDALRVEADKRQVSLSELTTEIVTDELLELGYPLPDKSD